MARILLSHPCHDAGSVRTSRTYCSILGVTSALLCALGLPGCGASTQTFRLNPEQEPEQYRVTCAKRFRLCELEAEKVCGGEYVELERLSNRPEMPTFEQSDVSSTGPSMGLPDWKGELTIRCGRDAPALPLVRSQPVPEATTLPAPAPEVRAESVCIPGETQACLGPGACSGAQACLAQGQGFGPCDCGDAPTTSSSTEEPLQSEPPPQVNSGP